MQSRNILKSLFKNENKNSCDSVANYQDFFVLFGIYFDIKPLHKTCPKTKILAALLITYPTVFVTLKTFAKFSQSQIIYIIYHLLILYHVGLRQRKLNNPCRNKNRIGKIDPA